MTLEQFFAENREVAVAFSGGVDSAYLLYAAKRYAARVKAYYVSTAFQPEFELADARRLADELGADMLVLHVDVLSNSAVTANPPDRYSFLRLPAMTPTAAITAKIRCSGKSSGRRKTTASRCCWTAPTPPTTRATGRECGRCGSCPFALPSGSVA